MIIFALFASVNSTGSATRTIAALSLGASDLVLSKLRRSSPCFPARFMLGEYKVNRCTRQCHELGRPLKEGEWYYSVIVESGEDFIRRDYSAEAWTEPPAEAIGWWKKRMPRSDEKKLVLAPPEVLIDLVRQMDQFPAKAKSRYLLTLMLMRRRILRPATKLSDAKNTNTETDQKTMSVEVVSDGGMIEVQVCEIGRSEAESLKEELNELLYCDAAEEPELDDDETNE